MNKLFKDYYYSDANIYSNNELWKQIRLDPSYDMSMKRKDFDKWLEIQEDEQTKKVKYKPPIHLTHPIIGKPNSYQSDLMFLKDLHNLNNGYDSIINFVEITTKKAYAYPLKSKTPSEVFKAFLKFFTDIDGNIEYIELDKGTEFVDVLKFCINNKIHVTVYNGDKNSMSIVERFNRTLRGYISRTCKDGIWVHKLSKLIQAYNNKVHSATLSTPNILSNNPNLQTEIRERLIGQSIPAMMELKKFSVGDKVRVYKKRPMFGKGGGGYSDTVHTITAISGNSIFLDDDNNKKYRYYNLLQVNYIETNENKEAIIKKEETKNKAKSNYRVAHKLAKEQINRLSVKETDKKLQEILNDDTVGRGKRYRKPNPQYRN
jgi:hypothetical protein